MGYYFLKKAIPRLTKVRKACNFQRIQTFDLFNLVIT